MTEKKTVETTENETTTEKKPVAKAKVKTEEKKPNVFKRAWNWTKKNKKSIAACGASFVGGAATAVGTGILLNKRAEKKARNAYIPTEPQDYDTLDPNV